MITPLRLRIVAVALLVSSSVKAGYVFTGIANSGSRQGFLLLFVLLASAVATGIAIAALLELADLGESHHNVNRSL